MVELFVTYLDMVVPPAGPPLAAPLAGTEIQQETLDPDSFLTLYRAVGTPLRWDQRLRMPKAALHDFLSSPTTLLHILRLDGVPIGLCEFDGADRDGGRPETARRFHPGDPARPRHS